MGFSDAGNERGRLLVLVIAAAIIEILIISGTMFSLLERTAQWWWPHTMLALALPRFSVMTLLAALLGPFQQWRWFGMFLALYALLLFVRFNHAEVFFDWSSAIGASRATLPYVAGLAGAILG